MAKSETICWDCVHSVHNMCPWASRFEPVEGWVAERTTCARQTLSCPEGESYIVKSCPLFEEDPEPLMKDMDDAARDRLIFDIIAYAIREWKKATGVLKGGRFRNDGDGTLISDLRATRMLTELESFFQSAWFATLTSNGMNSERILSALRNNEVPTVSMLSKGGF